MVTHSRELCCDVALYSSCSTQLLKAIVANPGKSYYLSTHVLLHTEGLTGVPVTMGHLGLEAVPGHPRCDF